MNEILQTQLKDEAKKLGADIVGFCALPHSPLPSSPNLSYAVSIGVKLSDAILQTIENAPSFVYFQHYRTANGFLGFHAPAGHARITQIVSGKKHPYHLKRTGKKGPYGWVDHNTFSKS
jgi:hypothetical protein